MKYRNGERVVVRQTVVSPCPILNGFIKQNRYMHARHCSFSYLLCPLPSYHLEMSLMNTFTAVVADDHQLIRSGLVEMLNSLQGMTVVGEAVDGISAVSMAKKYKPDLMTLDIAMPYAQGIAVFTEVKRWSPYTKIAVFSGITSAGLMQELHYAGANGLFTKRGDIGEFEHAIPLLLKGGRFISSDAAEMINGASKTLGLSIREQQILSLIANGQTSKSIAQTLGLSTKTVENHRANIMTKLDVSSMAELLAFALREGLLDGQSQL